MAAISSPSLLLPAGAAATATGTSRMAIKMEGPVLRALRKWLRHNTSGHLLITPKGEAMTPNGITKLLTRVGQQRLKRSLGSSLLRHSYLSHKYADVNEEKQADADLMGHSQAMQDGYIKH